jgi:hypothetical protein
MSPLLKDISEKAASAFGEAAGSALVEKLWDYGDGWFDNNPESAPPEVSALAVRSYMQKQAFSSFARHQVVAWAMWELRGSVNRRVTYVSRHDGRAVESLGERSSIKSCQPIDGSS